MANRYSNHERFYSDGYELERSSRNPERERRADPEGFGRGPVFGIESRGSYPGRYDFDEEMYDRRIGYGRERYTGPYGESEGRGYGREGAYGGAFGELTGRGYDAGRSSIYGGARGQGTQGIIGSYYNPDASRASESRREARGRYAGRGPKNYRRSDERIAEDINERLTEHPGIDATEIEVRVSDGQVTLAGSVENRHAKYLAEEIAESVSGVRDISNQLRVGPQGNQVQSQENLPRTRGR
ncbi:MAG TPA: BON domain-containing protein [Blastocatellia bacterium]|nr:BON domain-containing protein [Blastocatellia bacterium]